VAEPLQHLHPAAGAREVRGGHQPVVPAADDNGVGLRHPALAKVALDLARRPDAGLVRIAAGLPQRASLTQQIPALVECDLEPT
jgi:hypothetical protein